MNILIISDSFPPMKTASAGMINILADELKKKNKIFIFTSSPKRNKKLYINNFLFSWRNGSYLQKLIFEFFNTLILTVLLFRNFRKIKSIDLIIWYCPSAFLWVPVLFAKIIFKSKVLMILRDIFPDWLYHVNILKSKILFSFFRFIVYPQYLVPDLIGCQTSGDKKYLEENKIKSKITVLKNWPSIKNINKEYTNDRIKKIINNIHYFKNKNEVKVFTYLGSSTIAQDLEKNILFLQGLSKTNKKKILFNLFVKDVSNINKIINENNLNNIFYVWHQIDQQYIYCILKNSDFGIVSLNEKHKTNNIPGKFVTYTQFSLPIVCFSNSDQDLTKLIMKYKNGYIISGRKTINEKLKLFEDLINLKEKNMEELKKNSYRLFNENFHIKNVINQIEDFNRN